MRVGPAAKVKTGQTKKEEEGISRKRKNGESGRKRLRVKR